MKLKLLALLLFIPFFAPTVYAAKPTPTPTPTSTKIVCLDPGHGGTEIGTSNGGILEKNLNLEVANKLATILSPNYTVYVTRNQTDGTLDANLSNADRYNFCNNKKATILVSIHHNGSTDSSIDYSSALYMKKTDVDLANAVVNAVSTGLNINNHGISRFASGVILKANMPATISEGFFLTNTNEYSLLNDATTDRRLQEAQALATGIDNYFTTHSI